MAGRRVQPPSPVQALSVQKHDDPVIGRMAGQIEQSIQDLQRKTPVRSVVTADLVVGSNHIPHGLERAARGYTLVATVADASFAHAVDTTNPHPERELWVSVIGVAQPGAVLEIW